MPHYQRLFGTVLVGVVATGSGCLSLDDTTEATTAQEISGGSLATSSQARRAVAMAAVSAGPTCTGTQIAPNWVLTAASCDPQVGCSQSGCRVHFYGGNPASVDTALPAQMTARYMPSNTTVTDHEDEYGFSDLVLVKLDRFNHKGINATLAWRSPTDGTGGEQVGAGQHDGNPNVFGELRRVTDYVDSDPDYRFDTEDAEIDDGDIGGPFYVEGRVAGVLHGNAGAVNDYSIYTNVPKRLHWILSRIAYRWSGAPPINGIYGGTVIGAAFEAQTEQVCQYACERTTQCVAYNYAVGSQTCDLRSTVTSSGLAAGYRAGLKHGESRASMTGSVVGYHKVDGTNALVHRNMSNIVRQAALVSGWTSSTIQAGGGAPSAGAKLSPYRRSDGLNAVVYRSGSTLVELVETSGIWTAYTLPIGALVPAGDPAAYVRADGLTAVIFRTTGGKIIELLLRGGGVTGGWAVSDLSTLSGAGANAVGDPTAYVRSDGYTSVLYRNSASGVTELYWTVDAGWGAGNLTGAAGCTDTVSSNPHGYVRNDGTNAVVFRNSNNDIIEMFVSGSQWQCGEIGGADLARGEPYPYVRNDGRDVVLYRRSDGHVMEIANQGGWATWDLTFASGGPAAVSDPVAYLRTDGYNAVVYEVAARSVIELFQTFGGVWSYGILGEF